MADVGFSCTCGALTGRLTDIGGGSGTHVTCFCNACRSAEIFLGQPDPAPAGVALYQTTPDRVHIDTGADRLAVLALTDSKTRRWYASCCNSPLAITGPSPGMPFVSFAVARAADPSVFGPVRCQAFVPQPGGKQKHKRIGVFVWGLIRRTTAARLSGRWRQTPFFDIATGQPVAPLRRLTAADRKALPLGR